jgi:hypothetical protein
MAAVLEEHEVARRMWVASCWEHTGGCRVPGLKGLTLTKARRALASAHCATGRVRSPSTRTGTAYRLPSGGRESGRAAFGADRAQNPVPESVRGTVASTCCW